MRKNNFFNFKEKNIWDIGWPCSPRLFFIFISFPLIVIFTTCVLSSIL